MRFVFLHILESTILCIILSSIAYCFRKEARVRHIILLAAVSKFAIPSLLLTSTGALIASSRPAPFWLAAVTTTVSGGLATLIGMLPSSIEDLGMVTGRSLILVWALGTAITLGMWIARMLAGNEAPATLSRATSEEQEALIRAIHSIQASPRIQLSCCEPEMGTALRGIWHPVITIPLGLSSRLSPSELEAVLLHELAHAMRLDNLKSVCVRFVVCLFWFHPLLWLLEWRLAVERERACDDLVIACGTNPQVYVSSILKVCRFNFFEAEPGVSRFSGSDLQRRLELILEGTACGQVTGVLVASFIILILALPVAGGYCEQCVSNGHYNSQEERQTAEETARQRLRVGCLQDYFSVNKKKLRVLQQGRSCPQ